MAPVVQVRVAARWACITDPTMRSERVSYPFLTSSAAKGILRSLYWKPEFEWVVHRILIMKPVQRSYYAVTERFNTVKSQITGNLVLRDVDYVIEATPVPNPLRNPNPKKIIGETVRRLRSGQSWRTPFLGKSEFRADWEFIEPGTPLQPADINMTVDGFLWDLVPVDIHKDHFLPIFHRAEVIDGVYTPPTFLWRTYRDQIFKARNAAHPHRM